MCALRYRLEADLLSVDRAVTPWIIFGGHRAMYVNSGFNDHNTSSKKIS